MVAEKFSLEGKKALIAGKSKYWTKYVAGALARAGADIAIAGIDKNSCAETLESLKRTGRKVIDCDDDLTTLPAVEATVNRVVSELGHIDILVNANDLWFAKPLTEMTEGEWRMLMDTNLTSLFLYSRAVGKHMLARSKGRIINLASCLAERGLGNASAYCSTMGGILQFTRAAALEWARSGITVNAIGLGWFCEHEMAEPEKKDRLIRYIPMKRYGHPAEIGALAVYLASDAAAFVTGQIMYVDGAVTLHM